MGAALLLIGIDRLTKWLAVQFVMPELTIPVVGIGGFEILNFTYLENTGAAFGIFRGQQMFLIVVTGLFTVGAIAILFSGKIKSKLMLMSITLIIGGAVGNLIDRIFYGYVVDFIELKFINFAIFNFADMCVVVGAFLMCFCVISEEIRDFKARRACAVEPDDE
jgi:signal peptidase II